MRARRLLATLVTRGVGSHVAFSPDGTQLATSGGDQTVQLWDVSSREEIATFRGHKASVATVSFSPDGRSVASGSFDTTIRFWSTRPRDDTLRPAHLLKVSRLAFSSDGNTYASGGDDGSVRLWDAATGRPKVRFDPKMGRIYHLAFSPRGRLLAAGNLDRTVKLWDLATQKELLTLRGTTDRGPSADSPIAFSPDGRTFAMKADDTSVRLLDIPGRRTVATLTGHREFINDLAFSPDGRTLATSSHDLTVILWDVPTHKRRAVLTGHWGWAGGVSFSPDGRFLATGSGDGTVKIWDLTTNRKIATLRGHRVQVSQLGFSPDGKSFFTSSVDQTVKLWSVGSWQEVLALKDPDLSSWAAAFSQDSRTLLTGREDGRIHIWRAASLATVEVRAALVEHRTEAEEAERESRWIDSLPHLDRLIAAEPDHEELRERRGRARAELGRWEEAAADFRKVTALQPEDPAGWSEFALTRLAVGATEGYRRTCASMLRRFEDTENPWVAAHVARALSLTPNSALDPVHALRLAERPTAYRPNDPGLLGGLGLALYRAARYEAATQRLNAAVHRHPQGGTPEDWLVLAMAHQALGRRDEAQRWLDKAARQLEQDARRKPDNGTNRPEWNERLRMQLLRREAEALLLQTGSRRGR